MVVLPTENAYDMGYDDGYDDGYIDGESSVDITSDNADVYDDGYAAGDLSGHHVGQRGCV